MTIQQIKQYWAGTKEVLYPYKPSQLKLSVLTNDNIDLLLECGLPANCAPGFIFNECKGAQIPRANDVFPGINPWTSYLLLGSNGHGDPICIDLDNNNVVLLKRDNDFERIFMNMSARHLAGCLIHYRNFYNSLNPTVVNGTVVTRPFSRAEVDALWNAFYSIDPNNVQEDTFWQAHLDGLRKMSQ